MPMQIAYRDQLQSMLQEVLCTKLSTTNLSGDFFSVFDCCMRCQPPPCNPGPNMSFSLPQVEHENERLKAVVLPRRQELRESEMNLSSRAQDLMQVTENPKNYYLITPGSRILIDVTCYIIIIINCNFTLHSGHTLTSSELCNAVGVLQFVLSIVFQAAEFCEKVDLKNLEVWVDNHRWTAAILFISNHLEQPLFWVPSVAKSVHNVYKVSQWW